GKFALGPRAVTAAAINTRPGMGVARWKMNDVDGSDSVGTFPGTITGTAAAGAVPIITSFVNPPEVGPNTSLLFDGTTTLFTVTHNTALNVGINSFTIAGWFKILNRTVNQDIINKWDAAGNAGNGLGWRLYQT